MEWCWDENRKIEGERIKRSGGWYYFASDVHVEARYTFRPSLKQHASGGRLVRSPDLP